MARDGKNVIIENAEILFRNFAGREREFNSAGERNFCVLLDKKVAAELKREGWNIKELKPREEGDEPKPYVKVKVNYGKGRPPRSVMITSRGRVDLGQDEVEIFDWADIKKVDLILSPYEYNVNGNTGISTYLKSIFVTINEDPLELKYAHLDEVGRPTTEDEEVGEDGVRD